MKRKAIGRYENLYEAADVIIGRRKSHLNLLEVGTRTGKRAASLLEYFRQQTGGSATYVGFDAFEAARPGVKYEDVLRRLEATGAGVRLFKGDTRDTLTAFVRAEPAGQADRWDVVVFDPAADPDTLNSDWAAVRLLVGPRTVVMLDDYHEGRDDVGCKALVDVLTAGTGEFEATVLDPVDDNPLTGLRTRMVRLEMREWAADRREARAA